MRRTSSSCALCWVASREGQQGVHSEPQGNCRPAVDGGSACVACSCFTGENQSCRHLFDSTRQLLQGHEFALGGDVLALFRPHSANRYEREDAGCAISRTMHERRSLLRSCTSWAWQLMRCLRFSVLLACTRSLGTRCSRALRSRWKQSWTKMPARPCPLDWPGVRFVSVGEEL